MKSRGVSFEAEPDAGGEAEAALVEPKAEEEKMVEPVLSSDRMTADVPLEGPEIATLWQLLEGTPCHGINFVRRVSKIADKLEAANARLPSGARAQLGAVAREVERRNRANVGPNAKR